MEHEYRNMHILCFDPMYKKQTGDFQGVVYEGSQKAIEIVEGVKKTKKGSALLSYYHPDAKKVEVAYCTTNGENRIPMQEHKDCSIQYQRLPMIKGEDDYWRLEIHPGVGYHDIFYFVDGVKTIHTQAPYGYDGDSLYNFIDLTEDEDFLLQDVPHGRISRELYTSSVTKRIRSCWVYTPPEYFTSQESYPILYVQHGGGEDEICWFQSGKIDIMMDNLIAQGRVKPMIIVANNGYAMKKIDEHHIMECRLDEVIINDCMPHIERSYRVKKDRKYHAAAGLSMGGGHVRRLVFAHPDCFANVGIFSSFEGFPTTVDGYDFSKVMGNEKVFNQTMDTVLITCGDGDPRIFKTRQNVEDLQDAGFHIDFASFPGHHEWNVWRASMKAFVEKLFHKKEEK